MEAHIRDLQRDVDVLQRQMIRYEDRLTSHIQHEHDTFRELVRTAEAGPQDRPADAGSSSSMSKMPPKRTTTTTTPMSDATIKALVARSVADALAQHEANKSINEDDSHDSRTGVVGLTQCFERMESVFHISNCTIGNQVKYATCTLLGNALTWWNSHIKIVGHDAAYGMPWKTLMKMITDKYCPRELALLCGRMFLEVSDMVEKYVGGLPDMIQEV
ncbi:hypothetical protein Tco_0451736 [Tanacetum coccineum]